MRRAISNSTSAVPNLLRTLLIVAVAASLALLAGYAVATGLGLPTDDTTYLTRVPEETLFAYRVEPPISDKLEAVVAARLSLQTSRLRFARAPTVLSVESLKLEDAHKRVEQPGIAHYEDRPGDTNVWLVIFKGEAQVFPPDPEHTYTPPPPQHGCFYVMSDANGSRTQMGGMGCNQ